MASLQDQLLKAGLSTKQKARQANTDKRRVKKQKNSGVKLEDSLQEKVQQDLIKSKAEKQAKDTQLNAEKKQALIEKEKWLRIEQILQHHAVKRTDGELAYNYTLGSVVKKLFVNDIAQRALINGRLALCGLKDITYIVTAETAEKIATIDNSVILLKNDKVEDVDAIDDDPYAEFQIPDDLMW